ncbi:MAG: peptidylprolyl isomerase [Pseudomonadota bacterium]
MRNWIALLGLVVWMAAIGCGGPSSGKVLAEVNGSKITEGDLKFLGEINPRIKMQINDPAGQKRILDNLVEQDLLYQEAVREGINHRADVKAKIDLYRRVIISQSLIDADIEKAAKKYYDEHQGEFNKLVLSHIMVKYAAPEETKNAKKGEKLRTEEEALKEAQDIKARIDKGEEFAKVAKDTSDDVASKARGGDLGPAMKDEPRLVQRGFGPLLEKASELKVGEVAGPIKTDKGYHIITVTRGLELEPFDEAKQMIVMKLRDTSRQDLLARLKKDAKISFPEDEKKEAEAKKQAGAKPAEGAQAAAPAEGAASPEAAAAKPAPAPEVKAPAPPAKTPAPAEKPTAKTDKKAPRK